MSKFLLSLVLSLLLLTGVMMWVTSQKTNQRQEIAASDNASDVQIGGDFTLTDQNGQTVRSTDLRGKVMLVFFGFTSCPDICPVTSATLSKTMALLGSRADQVAPLFISVDPEHDTPAVLKDFLANFDKHIIGLTGTPDQIRQLADAYKTYYAKTLPAAKGEGYSVDHSGFIYMMGKDGKYIRIFPYNANEQDIASAVSSYLN